MANQSSHTFILKDVSPERAMEVLASEDFEIAQTAVQEGNQSCTVREISRTDDKYVYDLNTVEYAKGVTGIDRNKTVNSTTRVEWDLKARKSSWTYEGPHGKRARVWGSTQVTPSGDGSKVRSEFNIEVKIPLVGGKVEKLVIKETEKHWRVFERIVREQA